MSELTKTYHGVEITYRESDDRWVFTLDDKERSSSTLTLAKKAIDTEPREKKKPVEKVKAYYLGHYDTTPKIVEVGAQAETDYRGAEFWIYQGKERSKESGKCLYLMNEKNEAAFAEMASLDKEKRVLEESIRELKNSLDLFTRSATA